MRYLFHGPGPTEYRPASPIAYTTGVSPVATTVMTELERSFKLTGNKGNIIHAEAPVKLFRKNEARSVSAQLAHVHNFYKGDFGSTIKKFFDVVVISTANFIRPGQDHSKLIAAIEALDPATKVVVLGAGIQDKIEKDDLHPTTLALIELYCQRASVFGVRGEETHQWLEANGYKGSVVLGCPSLYVFPLSIMGIRVDRLPDQPRIISAGHLSRPKLTGKSKTTRGIEYLNAFKGIAADYVFQDEIFSFTPHLEQIGFYNEGTSECHSATVKGYLGELTGKAIPFERFYYFNDASAWRQSYRAYDVYVGDRFHGGVAALQAGVPALFLQHDRRVSELTEFFQIPTMTIEQFAKMGLKKALQTSLTEEALANFKRTYLKRLQGFVDEMGKHGIEIVSAELLPQLKAANA